MREFLENYGAVRYELLENFRSKQQIVTLANDFVRTISQRMKSNPLVAKQHEEGSVRIVKHRSSNLEIPIVEALVREERKGSTCVLTATNEEALRVMGLLLNYGVPARLIQTSNGFDLYHLAEIRSFLKSLGNKENSPTISDQVLSINCTSAIL